MQRTKKRLVKKRTRKNNNRRQLNYTETLADTKKSHWCMTIYTCNRKYLNMKIRLRIGLNG